MMRQRRDELDAVEFVVVIVIVHLEVMKLQLFLCHFLLRFRYLTIEVLHYVPYIHTTCTVCTHISHTDTDSYTVSIEIFQVNLENQS